MPVKAKPLSEHRANIQAAEEMGEKTITCPFCQKDVALKRFPIHCVGGHRMNRAKIDSGLKAKDAAAFALLNEYRRLTDLAHRGKNALRAKGESYKSQRSGHDTALARRTEPPPAAQHQVQITTGNEVVEQDEDTQAALQELAVNNQAVQIVQNTAVMLSFSSLLAQHGPEKMQAMLAGIARMGNLPTRK